MVDEAPPPNRELGGFDVAGVDAFDAPPPNNAPPPNALPPAGAVVVDGVVAPPPKRLPPAGFVAPNRPPVGAGLAAAMTEFRTSRLNRRGRVHSLVEGCPKSPPPPPPDAPPNGLLGAGVELLELLVGG